MNLVAGKIIADRYELKSTLGVGGSGSVWLVHDTLTDIDMALKFCDAVDDYSMNEFRKEYKLTYKLNHPNLMSVRHFGLFENMPFLIMPYYEKGSMLRKIGTMGMEEIWQMVEDVASGLDYLHSQNPHIVHQDIKPDNILEDDNGHYLITDFGISRRFRTTMSRSATVMPSEVSAGTIAYMGPERFSETPVVIMASDIWSLGMTVYEIATGEPMWEGVGGCAQLNGAKLPERLQRLPEDLSLLIRACLALNTWDRPTAKQIVRFAQTRNPQYLRQNREQAERQTPNREQAERQAQKQNDERKSSRQARTDQHASQKSRPHSSSHWQQAAQQSHKQQNVPEDRSDWQKLRDHCQQMAKRLNKRVAVIAAIVVAACILAGMALTVVIGDINENRAYNRCVTYEDYQQFLEDYPNSNKRNAAQGKLQLLKPKDHYRPMDNKKAGKTNADADSKN